MRYFYKVVLILLPVLALALGGCGGSSSGSSDPFTPGTGTPTTPTGAGTILSYNLTLSVTPTSGTGTTVGPNSIVIATVTLTDSEGNPVANQPVKFESVDGPVTIDPAIITTDSNGKAINFLRAGSSTTSAVDVIVKASSTVKGQFVTSVAIFKIMRSETNVIKFITTKSPTDPDGTLNTLKVTLDAVALPSPPRTILQLVPFQILDNNGIARTRVPVTISIYSQIGNCPVFIDSPETATRTVTTDDNGIGIFNAGVTIDVPPMGSENACSIIYKAEAPDINNVAATIFSYGGFIATLENLQPK
ncbi:Ig-like domain-containing protein [Geomonas sp. Red69]|uniref:Ig-like domain-containing protein n=1 Tax=Geomonas diazotrophica TaxID=2843197 RepID=UPI001C118503|nr:Ig-like domain-containing protein [Geomonas diazotrophica]MBU5636422.1 Ig-like domain-containing protein [Geomonas diazotrophica]